MYSFFRFILIFFLISSVQSVSSQETLFVHGIITNNKKNNNKIDEAEIIVCIDDQLFMSVKTNNRGYYSLELPYDNLYKIVFAKIPFVSKFLLVDLNNIPAYYTDYEMNTDIELFERINGLDYSILDNPIGKFKFFPSKESLSYDREYALEMQQKIVDLMQEHREKMDKELQELNNN